jgi:ABC-type antimicrobial peptide transport system permease subunit
VKQSLLLAGAGLATGLVAAALLMQFLRSFLFGVSVLDPVTFSTVAAIMFLLAIGAAWIPARRAAGVNPMETLRNE